MRRARARSGRIRVLHVIQNLNYGGMERVLADIVCHLDPSAFEPHVLALQYLGRFSREVQGVATLHRAVRLPRWSLLWPGGLAAQIREIAPDVVHTHSGVWYKATLAARLAGVRRIVHTEHGRRWPEPLLDRIIDRFAAQRTDALVTVSEALAAQIAHLAGAGTARVHMIPNGIRTEHFRPRPGGAALRAELGIAADAPLIGSVGRLEPVKGYDVMVRALAALHRRWGAGERPVLALVGNGSERDRLSALADEEGIAPYVHFLGWRDDVNELYPALDVFSLASHSEGTSVSLLEAMCSGVCPVVTRVGGNPEVVGDGLQHRLVLPGQPDALAAAWYEALMDRRARERDAALARHRVASTYSAAQMADAYAALYREDRPAISRRSGAVAPARLRSSDGPARSR